MDRRTLGIASALAGGTAVVLVCWAVLFVQADLAEAPATTRPLAPATTLPPPPSPELPVAPPRKVAPARTERMRTEPARLGPEAILGRVLEEGTGRLVLAFQVTVLPHAEAPPLERLTGTVPEPFHTRTGVFRVDRPPGRWDLVVRAPGFETHVLQDVVVPPVDGRPRDILLRRGPGLVGQVFGPDGMARSGVEAFLHVSRLDDAGADPPRITLARTDLEGRFSFSPLPAGEYAVSLLEPGNRTDWRGGLRVRDGTTSVQLTLQPRHQITFHVGSHSGPPVEGAMLELRGDGRIVSGRTNANGLVVLEHVLDGAYTVRVVHSEHEELEQALDLTGGSGHAVHWLTLERRAEDRRADG